MTTVYFVDNTHSAMAIHNLSIPEQDLSGTLFATFSINVSNRDLCIDISSITIDGYGWNIDHKELLETFSAETVKITSYYYE